MDHTTQKPAGCPTLKSMIIQQLVRNLKVIQDVGDMEYDFCRPFLRNLKNPEQLRTIEKNSRQIIGHDKELWANIIRSRFSKNIDDYPVPKRKDWYRVYLEISAQYEEEKRAHAAKLKAEVDALKEAKSKKRAILINKAPASFKRAKISATGFGRSTKEQNALQKAMKETATYTKNMNVAARYQQGQVRRELNGNRPIITKESRIEDIAAERAAKRGKEVVDGSVLESRLGGVHHRPSGRKGNAGMRFTPGNKDVEPASLMRNKDGRYR
ncbi:hypothetical protein BJ508DRAFT_314183 [Ascobolus immersus RN42]|uniref:Elongin-A n=1 Tax=Ascobolus immersus RN42 TaxID=1160509 RepID=A0A3N4HFX6_ASCIM|nr:hypothetical protein BJ508DRAFT_314183 [Ascobolus immersus RN42]